MADATTAVPLWFSALTFFGGLISSQLLEVFKDFRNSKREQKARVESRALTRFDRRIQFQRETLLSLQDELIKLGRTSGKLHGLDQRAFRTEGKRHADNYPEDIDQENASANARVSVLGSRVRDEQIALLLQQYRDLDTAAFFTADATQSHRVNLQAVRAFEILQKQIGLALREIDDKEDAHE